MRDQLELYCTLNEQLFAFHGILLILLPNKGIQECGEEKVIKSNYYHKSIQDRGRVTGGLGRGEEMME